MAAKNKAIPTPTPDPPKPASLESVHMKQPAVTKKELLLNMSHEIRPPMNGVIGMAQLLRTTALDATQLEYLDCLEVSAKSLFYLINDILDLARFDDGHPKLELADFSLRGIINNIIKTQHADLHFKNLKLTIDIPQTLPDIFRGDQLRTKQVLLNLVGNAVKYSEQGAVGISVAAVEQHEDQVLLQISITDTGIGMEQADLEELFASPRLTSTPATRKLGARGLGIAICKDLVEMMGGRIWAESSLGIGSAFHLVLPFTIMRQNASSVLRNEQDHLSSQWVGPMLKILLAEDNPINQKYAATILQRMGHQVISCSNGKEALKLFKHGEIDLILMDIQMPVMDGIEALAAIRSHEAETGQRTPIIALTAHAKQDEKEVLLESGFDGYVPKPVEVDVLIDEMHKVSIQALKRS